MPPMPRIPATSLSDAPEASKPVLAAVKGKLGMIPNLFATMAHSPAALQGYLGMSDALGTGKLTPPEVELINLHVSELNGCAYCVSAHTFLGERAGLSAAASAAARTGQGASPRESAILALVRRVVRTGGSRAGTELAVAREAGITDGEVMDILAHISLRSFANAVSIVADMDIDFPKAPRLPSS